MILFPGVHGHRQKYMLDRHKKCNYNQVHSYDVIHLRVTVQENNCCLELLLMKSMGGEFVTTFVEMAPGWPVRLCIAARLTLVEAPHGGSGQVSV